MKCFALARKNRLSIFAALFSDIPNTLDMCIPESNSAKNAELDSNVLKKQKSIFNLLMFSLLLAMLTLLPHGLYAAPRAGQLAPNFKVVTTSGQSVSLENYRGYVLVMDFFATWCQPCRESIPHLIEMNRKYGKQGLQVLGMSADEDGERIVKTFAEEHHITYPIALAGESTLVDYGVRSVPVMIIIDKKGRVAEVFRGFTDEVGRSSEQLIKKLLAEK